MISVIVPTFNEVQSNNSLFMYLDKIAENKNLEILVVDSGSDDGSWEKITSKVDKIREPGKTRAHRLNRGIKEARQSMILLHHPRSRLPLEAFSQLNDVADLKIWGGFSHKFDFNHPVLRFTSWYSNSIRLPYRKIVYLDHCLFFYRKLLSDDYQIPIVDIFEDTLISLDLKKAGNPVKLSAPSVTSSLRFVKNGIVKQCLLNFIMKVGFLLGVCPLKMNKLYEKGLSLNTLYKK